MPLASDVDLARARRRRRRASRAPICKNLVNEAALLAARREQDEVRQKDFLDALEKIVLGPERPLLLSREDRERIAYHESGHAILGLVVPGADPVHRVTIVPRGQALGVTYQRPQTDRYNYPEAYLRARIVGMLGGRAAEEIVYGTRTTGAENDIEQATRPRAQHGHALGHERRARHGAARAAREPLPRRRGGFGGDEAVQRRDRAHRSTPRCSGSSRESHEEAKRLLTEHRKPLDALVEALLARETLDEQEILEVTGLPPAPPLETGMMPAAPARRT